MTHNDAQLIRRTLAGESAAFGVLVQKYQDRLASALLGVCGSRHEAEDALQEALVQAFLKLASFAGESSFYTWLFRIALNTAISRRRRQKKNVSVDEVKQATGVEPADQREEVDQPLLRNERVELVRRALALLPEEQRIILVLRDIDGLDYEAIGQTLDLPPGTVRSRLHRARLQLKDQIDGLLPTGHDPF